MPFDMPLKYYKFAVVIFIFKTQYFDSERESGERNTFDETVQRNQEEIS
jgi:hypothetical protein